VVRLESPLRKVSFVVALNLRRRTAALLIGVAVGAATLAGCGMSASTVARIDNETITQQEYQAALDKAYADPVVGDQVKKMGSSYRTAYLSDMVTYEIAKVVAAKAGVAITDAEVDEKVTELFAGQSVEDIQMQLASQGDPVTAEQLRMRIARSVVNAKFGEKVTGKTQEQMTAEQLQTLKSQRDADPSMFTNYTLLLTVTQDQLLAQDWVNKANGGMTLNDAVASNPDPAVPAGTESIGEESYRGSDLAQQPDVLKQIAAIPQGQTGVVAQGPDQTGAFTYVVLTVKSAALDDDAALQEQASQAAEQEFLTAGMTESAKQAKNVEVEVNPRFGKVEIPQEGLPSVTVPTPDTFSEPSKASDSTPTIPGMPTGG